MTHDRTNAITDQFEAWLRGYTPPRSMENDADRQSAEKLSLLRIVLKYSPQERYSQFVTEALDECAILMKTRAWPTQNELGAAFRNQRKANPEFFASQYADRRSRDTAEINAERMKRGDAVGECWLYGILACEIIARRLVDEETMKRHRSAAYFNRRHLYGDEAALAWEAEAKEGHEKSKEVWRTRNDGKGHASNLDLEKLVKFPGLDHVAF